jgi:hypothetical protein
MVQCRASTFQASRTTPRSQFDEIESAIAKFENELGPFIIAIDLEIQRDIDTARGK